MCSSASCMLDLLSGGSWWLTPWSNLCWILFFQAEIGTWPLQRVEAGRLQSALCHFQRMGYTYKPWGLNCQTFVSFILKELLGNAAGEPHERAEVQLLFSSAAAACCWLLASRKFR